ncbi:MAG: T9SS type A sorting domain-containing protein [Ginsengibacter sp.]
MLQGGGGNDWVLDDINLNTCYPNLVNSPKDTATACAGFPLTLSDTVQSYFNNYNNFCWEKSADGVNWNSTGVCGVKVPVLVNGIYQYVVDTSFATVAADSGTFYRLKVGTTASNLSNPDCSVNNSQKIFMKVFNVSCTLLNTTILSFSGNVVTNTALLKWASASEINLKEYQIEKSTDGINFSQAGTVAAANDPNGSSYTFNDPEPISSVAYYRLKLTDFSNNGSKYSKIIVLYNKNASFKVTAVNPFKTTLKIEVFLPEDGNAVFNLYDLFGKIVSKKNLLLSKGTSQVILDDVESLSAGMYILRTQFNNKIIQNKLFKVD